MLRLQNKMTIIAVPHGTVGGVNVLNLIQGTKAAVESPTGAFEPFVIHYAETFMVPGLRGPYTILPWPAPSAPRSRRLCVIRRPQPRAARPISRPW